MRRCLAGALATIALASGIAAAQAPAAPPGVVVSIWYRGSPSGTPRSTDLELIRAKGFTGVTWPSRYQPAASELHRLATPLGLHVTLQVNTATLTPASALTAPFAANIDVQSTPPELLAALAWRALAHGARVISFDAGRSFGSGLEGADPLPWLKPAQNVAVQATTQARLIEEWRPAGKVTLDEPAPAGLDLALLADQRSWVLVVTNMSRTTVRGVAHLPAGVPGALWVNLLDGSLLSMINGPSGPKWSLELEAGTARVYVVNKS